MIGTEQILEYILRDLLADFLEKQLNSSALSSGYVGVSIPVLFGRYSTEDFVSQVDFDLEIKDLESKQLANTGPMAPYETCRVPAIDDLDELRACLQYAKVPDAYWKAKGKEMLEKRRSAWLRTWPLRSRRDTSRAWF